MLAREANLLPWYSAAADVLFAHYTRQLSGVVSELFDTLHAHTHAFAAVSAAGAARSVAPTPIHP
jgi:hypothetical protein